jgi:ankyrin repeat protein
MALCRATSCQPAPALALQALRQGDLARLQHLLDPAALDMDASYPEEGHTTLLQTALHLGNHSAVALLLEHGAGPARYNSRLKVAPVHVALGPEGGAEDQTVALLVAALPPGALEARDGAGQTALHLAAARGEQGLPALELLLARGAEPGARDGRAGHTPLDLAALADCWRGVERLARAGGTASPGTLQLLEQRRPASVRSLGLREAAERPPVGDSALAQALLLELPSEQAAPSPAWLELLARAPPAALDLPAGPLTLLQAAADRGLTDHLVLLLEAGAHPGVTAPGTRPALLLAAEAGRPEVLRPLLHHPDTRLEEVEGQAGRSALLELTSRPLQGELGLTYSPDYPACLEPLLAALEAARDLEWRRAVVNQQDNTGNTALHYATLFWPEDTVARLLRLGASVGLRNLAGEPPVSSILPSTLGDLLDSVCLSSNGKNPTNENFAISFDYSFLAPARQQPVAAGAEGGECCPLLPCARPGKVRQEEAGPELETGVLLTMARSPDHRKHLNHPVITSFLALKWSRIAAWYNVNILYIFCLVAILTSYIFANYAGHSISVTTPVCATETNVTQATGSAQPYGNDPILWILLTVLLFVLLGREVIQFLVAPLKHLSSFENILEIVLIVLISVLLFHGEPGCGLGLKREISAAVLLVSWVELLTMLGRHPAWRACNLYSTMFFRVLTTFLTFLLWYSLFIVAFGLGFYILLHNDNKEKPKLGKDKPQFFDSLGLAVVKTFSMFVGELEFSEVPFHVNPRFSYIFFMVFVFLMVVVLMNLLNGLAVSGVVAGCCWSCMGPFR